MPARPLELEAEAGDEPVLEGIDEIGVVAWSTRVPAQSEGRRQAELVERPGEVAVDFALAGDLRIFVEDVDDVGLDPQIQVLEERQGVVDRQVEAQGIVELQAAALGE